jgi:uncharacterized cupin superfamily protein
MTEIVNLFAAERKRDEGDPPGYEVPYARLGPLLGSTNLGMTVYELNEGQSICPYHYEYPEEEWLIVLEGHPTLRVPDSETVLDPGETVCFPTGPEGAHKVTNKTSERVLVAMLSTKAKTAVAVYPDSDKVGVWSGDGDVALIFPRSAAVEYFHGEL